MNLEQRVKGLERQNRFFKLVLLIVLIFCAVAAADNAADQPITAEGFTLVGPGGKKAAELKVTKSGPVLRMYDGSGNVRFALGIVKFNRDYDPAIGFFDRNENLAGHVRLWHTVAYPNEVEFESRGLGDPKLLK